MTVRILLIEDDSITRKLISEYLAQHGFEVSTASSLATAREAFAATEFDLVLLDLRLPDGDGLDLAREIRDRSNVPIVIVTARNAEVDRVLGLEIGADDYLVKPVGLRELLARIRTVLRRMVPAYLVPAEDRPRARVLQRAYRFLGWRLNTGTRRLIDPEGRSVEITNSEYNLLLAFLQEPGRILSRDQLLARIRLHDDIYDRSIDVQILRLRRKLEVDPRNPRIIVTERGAGYRFDAPVRTEDTSSQAGD